MTEDKEKMKLMLEERTLDGKLIKRVQLGKAWYYENENEKRKRQNQGRNTG